MRTSENRKTAAWLIFGGIVAVAAGVAYLLWDGSMNAIEHRNNLAIKQANDDAEFHKQLMEANLAEQKAKALASDEYAKKLATMDATEFAKFKADKEARLSEEAKLQMANTRLECQEEIIKIKSECANKVALATAAKEEAEKKYETINTLFTNKDEILKAKRQLEQAAASAKKAEQATNDIVIKLGGN